MKQKEESSQSSNGESDPKAKRFVQVGLTEEQDAYLTELSRRSGISKAQIMRIGVGVQRDLDRLGDAGYKVSDDPKRGLPVDMLLPAVFL